MQAAQNLFAGEQGVAYIPMPKGRGFTPRLVKVLCEMIEEWLFYSYYALFFCLGGDDYVGK